MNSNTNFRDILLLSYWVNLHSKINTWALIVSGSMFSYILVLPQIGDENVFINILTLLIGFCVGAVFVVVVSAPLILAIAFLNYFVKGSLGKKEILVDDKGITETCASKATRVDWSNVRRIAVTEKYIFIQISRIKFIIIPKRDFGNEYEFAKYYCELVRLRGNYSSV